MRSSKGTVRRITDSGGARSKSTLNLKEFYPKRSETARKGDFGRVVICGGSNRYAGCLALNSLAALRGGADLAIVVAPRRAADIVAGYSADLITIPCDTAFPDPKLAAEVLENADSLILGCGIVRSPESHSAIMEVIDRCQKPMIIDAEALHALASNPRVLNGKKALLTPNAGEYLVLAGKSWPSKLDERKIAAQVLAEQYGSTVIVKGSPDVISDGQRTHIDTNGSAYMTKGGYGDLLAGVAGAHLARSATPFDAARVAAFIVGRAGQIASNKLGESMLASDVLEYVPFVIRSR